jgi:hypothetical protein
MPIDSQHPDYKAMLSRWQSYRDAAQGEWAVKTRGPAYLPKPAGMQDEDYRAYVSRAKWYGATQRTMQGLAGAIMRKPPLHEVPSVLEPHLTDITLTGMPFLALCGQLLEEVLLMGRVGVLLDYTQGIEPGRPLWSVWSAEQIPLWFVETVGGQLHLRGVVLQSHIERPKADDPFQIEHVCQYRLHWLNAQGLYEVLVYESLRFGAFTQTEAVIPLRQGVPLDFVPFQFFAPMHLSPAITKSPLEDLVMLNYVNYRHSADYEHGLHLTALPTAVITGFADPSVTLAIGSQAVWQIPQPEAKVYFLEFQGAGLSSHKDAMDTDKKEMATLGTRLLEAEPDVAETLGAVQLRQSGEHGALAAWAQVQAEGVMRLLRWHAWWMGATDNREDTNITFSFNTDFAPVALSAQEMTALMQVWQGGGMSLDSFLWNLKQGERLPTGRSVEQEKALIETEAPAILPMDEPITNRRNGNGRQREEETEAAET